MRKLLKNTLPLLVIIFSYIVCGFSITSINLGLYYIAAYVTYLSVTAFYDNKIYRHYKKMKKINERVDRLLTSMPEPISKFKEWLDREKFLLRNDSKGVPYLQSSIATVRYTPQFLTKIVVSPTKINTEDYKVYHENEELKMKFEDYLAFLSKKDEDLSKHENDYHKTNVNSIVSSGEKFDVITKAMILCIRFQGYIFLILSLMKVQETTISNSVKVLTFITYMIIDNII